LRAPHLNCSWKRSQAPEIYVAFFSSGHATTLKGIVWIFGRLFLKSYLLRINAGFSRFEMVDKSTVRILSKDAFLTQICSFLLWIGSSPKILNQGF